MHGKKGKSGTKKYGRNEVCCRRYKESHKREKNIVKRIVKHLARHVHDKQAERRLHEKNSY